MRCSELLASGPMQWRGFIHMLAVKDQSCPAAIYFVSYRKFGLLHILAGHELSAKKGDDGQGYRDAHRAASW